MKRWLPLVILLVGSGLAYAGPMEEGLELLGKGKYQEALVAFDRELKVRPANTKAYMYAGMTAEKIPDLPRATVYWETLLKVSKDPTEQQLAKKHIEDCQKGLAPAVPTTETNKTDTSPPKETSSPFDRASDQFYRVNSQHFMVLAKNPDLAQKAADEGERHLKRITAAFLRGQIYPRVISVYIYKDHKEYVTERGLPDWSGGGYSYIPYSADNQLRRVDLYQLDDKGKFREDLLNKILPHELTHVVMEEWFGGRGIPRALNEGLAMYVEEGTHDDYEEISARWVKEGQYFHLKDLFGFRNYPPQVGVFYCESASVTRYLISHLTADQFNAMMDGLKKGEDMNTALCTATGKVGDLLTSVEENWVAAKKTEAASLPAKDARKKEQEKGPIKETQQK